VKLEEVEDEDQPRLYACGDADTSAFLADADGGGGICWPQRISMALTLTVTY
jgi:hypothetical protein